ncbi:hypothetical protein J577_1529 [Acinetobacter sp. 263903-1]|nr:hypothetical protein J577_1529 [Acinetobacter sp. 263903-1]
MIYFIHRLWKTLSTCGLNSNLKQKVSFLAKTLEMTHDRCG